VIWWRWTLAPVAGGSPAPRQPWRSFSAAAEHGDVDGVAAGNDPCGEAEPDGSAELGLDTMRSSAATPVPASTGSSVGGIDRINRANPRVRERGATLSHE
jgi:hypothetical protein